jgi:hypothetical protein
MRLEASLRTMNSEAVTLMQLGRNKEATSLLANALARAASQLQEEADADDNIAAAPDSPSTSLVDPTNDPTVGNQELSSSIRSVSLNACTDDHHINTFESEIASPSERAADEIDFSNEIFCRAFIIRFNQGNDQESTKSVSEIMSIVLFNAGLAFHRRGIHGGDSKSLTMALGLYEKAFVCLRSCTVLPSDPLAIIFLAVCTNMAHIHSEFYNQSDMEEWNDEFRRAFRWAEQAQILGADRHFFARREWFIDIQSLTVATAA